MKKVLLLGLLAVCGCPLLPPSKPLSELTQEVGQVWIGTVRPLAMRYGVFDDRRVVIAAAIPVLLPKPKPENTE